MSCFEKWYVSGILAVLLLAGVSAWGAPPETVNVHGFLLDADGFPLSGERDCVVRFFDAPTDGTALGAEINGLVEVSPEGTFTNCTGGDFAFGGDGSASGGKFHFCVGGLDSFTTMGSPIVIHCVRNGVAYP